MPTAGLDMYLIESCRRCIFKPMLRTVRSLPAILENEPCDQVNGVICPGTSSRSVIVCAGTVEAQVPRVLKSKVDVLDRPPRDVHYIAIAPRVVVGAAIQGVRWIEQGIGGSCDVEPSGRG